MTGAAELPPFLLEELAQAVALLPPDLAPERAGLRLHGFGDILASGKLDPVSQRHLLVHAAAVAVTALAAFERAAGRGAR